ncbi:MAG: NADH:ubiquinone reductase (Na(+)-transporting) subunit B [Chlamydiia bacterium]|nr:NADH:ubiquinone reductase (Na(+)-transporting) subunit B [Chlamydiia bacterium]
MLRKFLNFQLSLTEKGKPLHRFRPLISAADTFLYEAPCVTKGAPHIRDAVDLKRWMSVVILALLPCILVAIWNSGLQLVVYSSGDYKLMNEYLQASMSLSGYFDFAFQEGRWMTILKEGLLTFLPVMIISYAVGGLVEGFFACIRRHEIAEGFLVTGMLYPLVLPPTIPYWMVAVGVAVGVILSKELFGGTGMNIMNPALCCRAFLFFTFPGRMSGFVWAGRNPVKVRESLVKMNQEAGTSSIDAYSQATALSKFNISHDVKRVHIDAIASNNLGRDVGTIDVIEKQLGHWNAAHQQSVEVGKMTAPQLQEFVTSPILEGGLGLSSGSYEDAAHFASLRYGLGSDHDGSFFFGNMLGSMGEVSTFAVLIGALILILTRVGSWRTMLAVTLGAFGTALLFQLGARQFGIDGGAWNPAQFDFPAYKHLILGGLAFGIVYMATDPVSSPAMNSAKWVYGLFVGIVAIIIRVINPAYPEGVMLAILMGNVFAPLFDHYAAQLYRNRRRGRVTA